ncbi:MAG: hypothetical protein K2L89_02255 [Muribaculaceae bacterium]|nr:hypothetical protein [Muribaculaceae bacterium]
MTKLVSDNAINAAVKELAKGTKKISKSVGEPNGIAPLDMEALIPRKHIPFPVLVISGSVSTTASGVHAENEYFTDEPDHVELWRLYAMIAGKNRPVGFAVTEDGENFYRLWEPMKKFGLPSSEDLKGNAANCLFIVGNSLYRSDGFSYYPVLDLDMLFRERPSAPPADDCLYGMKNGEWVKITEPGQILVATARPDEATAAMLMSLDEQMDSEVPVSFAMDLADQDSQSLPVNDIHETESRSLDTDTFTEQSEIAEDYE